MPTIKPLKESDIQEAFVKWLKKYHPDIRHNHSPNEGKRKPWYTAYLKRMGMWNGWPDLELIIDGRIHFMEFKAPKGRMQDSQKEFQQYCIENGIPHAVPRSVEQAKEVFEVWYQAYQ